MVSRRSLTFVVLAACVTVSQPCVAQITDAEEVAIGKKMLAELAREGTFSVVHDEAAQARLKRVAEKIVKSAGRPGLEWAGGWQWLLVEFESGPNAMAGPGGFVLVDNRLLDELASDDELAYVLAHEAGHVVGRHGFRELLERSRYTVPLLDADLELLRKLVTGGLAYSRELETEADERALAIMERAGYDPKRAVQWYTALVYMNQDPAILTLWERVFGTHPPLIDRASHLAEYYENVLAKGPFLAFVRDNALWISKWDGTDQRRTSLSGYPSELEWSPRGDAVAVECDGNIYIVRATDLEVTKLTSSGQAEGPAWAPGGDSIACASERDIYLVSIDSRQKRRLTTTRDCHHPAWSPVGDRVVYARWWRRDYHPTEDKGLWVVGTTTGESQEILKGNGAKEWYEGIQFSPDGTNISYEWGGGDSSEQYIVDLRSEAAPTRVAAGGGLYWLPGGHYLLSRNNSYGWDPRESRMSLFRLGGGPQLENIAFEDRWVYDAAASPEWSIFAVIAGEIEYDSEGYPEWEGVCRELWLTSIFQLHCTRLGTAPAYTMDLRLIGWGPDARGILVERWPSEVKFGIWLAPLDATAWRELVHSECSLAGLSQPWPYVL